MLVSLCVVWSTWCVSAAGLFTETLGRPAEGAAAAAPLDEAAALAPASKPPASGAAPPASPGRWAPVPYSAARAIDVHGADSRCERKSARSLARLVGVVDEPACDSAGTTSAPPVASAVP